MLTDDGTVIWDTHSVISPNGSRSRFPALFFLLLFIYAASVLCCKVSQTQCAIDVLLLLFGENTSHLQNTFVRNADNIRNDNRDF